MQDKGAGNFLPELHDRDYSIVYTDRKIDHHTLISPAGRPYESLDGRWNFAPDWYDTTLRNKWFLEIDKDQGARPLPLDYDWEAWDTTWVPSCWNLTKAELRFFEGSGVYTRTFRYVEEKSDERVFLRFEGAQYRTHVFLNHIHLGTHDGGSTPFMVECTQALQEQNHVIVVIETRQKSDRVPMENTDWFNYGGLYRSVTLLRLPSHFIKDWFIRLIPDGRFTNIALDATGSAQTGELRLIIEELGIDQRVPVLDGKASIVCTAEVQLWSPENPKLYTCVVNYTLDGKEIDTVQDRIGFREFRAQGRDLYLNGKPIFLKGISVHEDHLELGKTTTEEIIRQTITHLRELHGNYLRLAHYPHDERFARIADEEGVMLWEEIPVYWAIDFENPVTYDDAENQLTELLLRDRNRASVVVWSVGNENPDTDARLSFMSRLAQRARALDDTRPVSAACLVNHQKLAIEDRLSEFLDIIGLNEYFGWYDPDYQRLPRLLENSNPNKPVIICEFGGGARAGHRGSRHDHFTEDMQKAIYETQTAVIDTCPYVKGMSPWILYDFRCPRRLNPYQEGFNRKGLIDSDRKTKKMAFSVLSDFYKKRR
jgi:beta-glucuronidase